MFLNPLVVAFTGLSAASVIARSDTKLDTTIGWYIVEAGQTLSDIAKLTNRGTCDIARFNRLADPGLLYAGENITIPAQVRHPSEFGCQVDQDIHSRNDCVLGAGHTYYTTVGDTIELVAARFNINSTDLLSNNLALGAVNLTAALPDLMNIKVPQCNNSICLISPFSFIQAGTYTDLCKEHGCVVGQLMAYNNGYNHSTGGTDGVSGPVLSLVHDCKLLPGDLDHSAIS